MKLYQRQEVNAQIEIDDFTGEIVGITPLDVVMYMSEDCVHWEKIEGGDTIRELSKFIDKHLDLANEIVKELEDEGS